MDLREYFENRARSTSVFRSHSWDPLTKSMVYQTHDHTEIIYQIIDANHGSAKVLTTGNLSEIRKSTLIAADEYTIIDFNMPMHPSLNLFAIYVKSKIEEEQKNVLEEILQDKRPKGTWKGKSAYKNRSYIQVNCG